MTSLYYRILPFYRRLFLSVVLLFLTFATCFILFQYNREKAYKSELLNTQLQNYNAQLYDFIVKVGPSYTDSLRNYIHTHMIPNLRVTVITVNGKVIYDNIQEDINKFQI